jgi:hypothetical protein
MKILSYLSSLLVLVVLLTACGKDGDNPSPGTATFRVDFIQTGDYEKFIKVITVEGGEFKYRGTNDKMPAAILGDNAKEPTWSVEGSNIDELEIETLTEFSAVADRPANMTMKFTVYKNGVLLEEKSFTYNDNIGTRTELLSYKAN